MLLNVLYIQKTKYLCEPKLDKRGMYDYISFKENYENKRIKDYMNIITYCDGSFSIFLILQ